MRFVHGLLKFNDRNPAANTQYALLHAHNKFQNIPKRDRLVDIHGWCLMKNHYHLLLSDHIERGISKFMMKMNVGYAKYFNEKNKRQGTLFQSRTKKILIESDAHFLHILHYIHLNPLDFLPGARLWRERKIENASQALDYLSGYRWSSYLDYCGKGNFSSLLTTELFRGVFNNYEKELKSYIQDTQKEIPEKFFLE